MKALLIHDHIFRKIESKYYSDGKFNYDYLSQYLKYCDLVHVIGRHQLATKEEINNLSISSGSKIKIYTIRNRNNHFMKLFEAFILIKKQMKKNDYDFVIGILPASFALIGIFLANKIKIPILLQLSGCPKDALFYYGTITAKIASFLVKSLTKYFVRRSKYIIYVTNKYLQMKYPSYGMKLACSSINLEIMKHELLEKRIMRYKNGLNRVNIGLIGSFSADYKGIDTALKALQILVENYNYNVELRLLGQGIVDKYIAMALKLNVNDHFVYSGVLPNRKAVYKWLDSIDLYIQPSRTEGLPRATIEAMSRGLPTVTSNVGDLPELTNSENMHAPDDFKLLAEKLSQLIVNVDSQIKYARINYSKSLQFKSSKLNKKREKFWTKFINDIRK